MTSEELESAAKELCEIDGHQHDFDLPGGYCYTKERPIEYCINKKLKEIKRHLLIAELIRKHSQETP
jgi:hypothetical protein